MPPTQRHALDPAQEEAAAAELEAKRRVFKLRKQLAEARTLQASVRIEEKNYQRWRDVREETAQLKKGALGAGSALDVPAATDEEVGKVSAAMMFQLAKMEVDPSKRAWYKLFKAMDENGDGHITFDELMVLIRKTVKLSEEDLSEKAVSAVWHSIDLDGNGWIDAGEFGRFFRLGEKPYREQRAKMFKEAIAEAKRIEPQEKVARGGGGRRDDHEAAEARGGGGAAAAGADDDRQRARPHGVVAHEEHQAGDEPDQEYGEEPAAAAMMMRVAAAAFFSCACMY